MRQSQWVGLEELSFGTGLNQRDFFGRWFFFPPPDTRRAGSHYFTLAVVAEREHPPRVSSLNGIFNSGFGA